MLARPDSSMTSQRLYTRTRRFHSTFLLIVALVGGCDADNQADGGDDGFRTVPTVAAWDEVICTYGTAERCYAHAPDAEKLWMPVVSWCDLKGRVDAGEYVKASSGWYWGCDYGGTPQTFDDVLCFNDSLTHVVCFGGSDGWFVQVEPYCATAEYDLDAWPDGTCEPDTDVGDHSFDSIKVRGGGPCWWGRVTNGTDAFYAVPECVVPTGVQAANPYSC